MEKSEALLAAEVWVRIAQECMFILLQFGGGMILAAYAVFIFVWCWKTSRETLLMECNSDKQCPLWSNRKPKAKKGNDDEQ